MRRNRFVASLTLLGVSAITIYETLTASKFVPIFIEAEVTVLVVLLIVLRAHS